MLPPSILMTDEGDGPETITIYPVEYRKDEEGRPIPIPARSGKTYPAVVSPSAGSLESRAGSDQSINSYDVTIYCDENPRIVVDTRMTWSVGDVPMIAQGFAAKMGRGAWNCQAIADISGPRDTLYRPTR